MEDEGAENQGKWGVCAASRQLGSIFHYDFAIHHPPSTIQNPGLSPLAVFCDRTVPIAQKSGQPPKSSSWPSRWNLLQVPPFV
jgi:hypothetical protein